MLTFPALNGLGFFFSRQENIEAMAQTMLWMPLLNGALCAAYMLLFLVLGRIDGSPTSVAWVLIVAMTLVWFACVTRNKVSAGIPHDRQLAYGVATSAVGALLVAVVYVISSPESVATIDTAGFTDLSWVSSTIRRSFLKIELFAATLALFIMAVAYVPLSDPTRGILSGLPLVPFGGLLGIAGDSELAIEERFKILDEMIGSVWIGPAVAVWFIYWCSRFLVRRRSTATTLGALLVGLVLSFLVIVLLKSDEFSALLIDARGLWPIAR
jgi:hypothetical protein